ncbi:MAG: ABC transporter ATP-binding protein [Lachnospiraceae bacterium]|nr:ABC transporter ATP-binding protein [Lachnospiraceae bacterium]
MKRKLQVKTVIFMTVKRQKYLSAGIFCAVVGAILLALVPPLILARIVDTITAGKTAACSFLFLYFAALAAAGFLESAREGLLTVFGQKITHALRSALMEKFTALTADEMSRQEPGALVSRFVGDVDTVENLFTSGLISMFADACKIISILVVIWFQNRGLTLVLLILLPFLFWFTRHVQENMLAAQIENRRAVGRASNHVPETLHNIRTIHCLGKETYMEQRYDRYIGESYQAMERTNFYDAVYSPVILILNAVVVAAVMLLSASGNPQVLKLFGMSAGTAVAVINYISQIFGPVESLGMEIQTIQSAVAGIHRINEFFALEELEEKNSMEGFAAAVADKSETENRSSDENTAKAGAETEKTRRAGDIPFVEFRDVVFGYDEHVVLNHVSFKVMDGDQVTLAGRTGAGKSTILKLLLGLYEPQNGEVLIHGVPAAQIKEEKRRKLFGYVEQTFHMVPGTVREEITLFDPAITEAQVHAAAELTGLKEAIESLENGYDTVCTPELFSQGQWQLLSIARAAAADPSLLLLDEITANLDAETEKAVLQALKRVARNRTVVSISHRTSAEMGRIIAV